MTMKEIGAKLGVHWSSIRKHLLAQGVQPRPHYRFSSDRNPTKGVGHSSITKAKLRAANEKQFADPTARERHALLTCKQIAEGRTGKAYNNLESKISTRFENAGIRYLQQYRVGRFVFDFYLPDTNTLIEAHGTFWHADPRFYDHEHLSPIQRRNVENDRRKAERALKGGYSLEIIWEADLD
jgi:G:T-mismatch repair DNA endonuclease (very short patch repair protein)